MPRPLGDTPLSTRVPEWCKAYVALASAKMHLPKKTIVEQALTMHARYLVDTGVLRAGDVPRET